MKHLFRPVTALLKLKRFDWRSEAEAWIERLRKGDLTVEVRGRDGSPVANARVK